MYTTYDPTILSVCPRVTFACMHEKDVYYSIVCVSNNYKQHILSIGKWLVTLQNVTNAKSRRNKADLYVL